MERNFVATLKPSPTDDGDHPNWFVQFEFHDAISGLHGDIVTIELCADTSERDAQALVEGLNRHGERMAIRMQV